MNERRTKSLVAAAALCALALMTIGAKAQTLPPNAGPPVQGSQAGDGSIGGEGSLISSPGQGLSCDRQKWYVQGEFIKVRFSFRKTPAGDVTGSWTVRSIYPAERDRPETVVAYYFDGRFTGGSLDPAAGGFDLRGTTNYSALCNQDTSTDKQVRIWGNYLAGGPINFEVTDGNGRFAHGTFKRSVLSGQREVNTTLDRH